MKLFCLSGGAGWVEETEFQHTEMNKRLIFMAAFLIFGKTDQL
jgi:hypothetical protein